MCATIYTYLYMDPVSRSLARSSCVKRETNWHFIYNRLLCYMDVRFQAYSETIAECIWVLFAFVGACVMLHCVLMNVQ